MAVYWVLGHSASAEWFGKVAAFENGHLAKITSKTVAEAPEAQLAQVG
jgi:hypothetical protein